MNHFYKNIKFQTKVMVLINSLILIIFLALSIYIHQIISQNIQDEVGKKALAVSTTISNSPMIIEAFGKTNPSTDIQKYTQSFEDKIDAEFIVVGDKNEVRLAHPIPERIGQKMVGGDNERALLNGESYISKSKGSIGLSIRGKTPIIKDGEIVGVVSVGYLLEDINSLVWQKNKPIFILLIFFLITGLIGSIFIARHLKGQLHGMEPKEIAELLLQKEGILESVREGIIAVDQENRVTMINPSALDILKVDHTIIGQSIKDALNFPLMELATAGRISQDEEYFLNKQAVFINVSPLKSQSENYGAVITFRRKTDFEKITQELNAVQQYSEGLRAQTHEFSNKIHTIYGLIQLAHYEAANKFIKEILQTSALEPTVNQQIKDSLVKGLLIGKLNIAKEKNIQLDIDQENSLKTIENESIRQAVLLALGNLIDNAFDALKTSEHPEVYLFLTDIGKNIVIEVEDNGPGIDTDIAKHIFEDGISTKATYGHGKGLFLVKHAVESLDGQLIIQHSNESGTNFMVIIPKEN